MITEDGRTIVFASERVGGLGRRDLWMAARTYAFEPFGVPRALAEMNSNADDYGGWLSRDEVPALFLERSHRRQLPSRLRRRADALIH